MEKFVRKVQKLKNGSYLLTLPKEWCDENNLDDSNEVELVVDKVTPKSILVQLPTKDESLNNSKLIIDDRAHKSEAARRRAILGGYLEGYDTIKLMNVSRQSKLRLAIRDDIQNLAQKLDGCSVNEEEKLFELTISSGLQSPIDLLEKLYSTTKLMFDDVFKAYFEYDTYLSKDLIQRDDQADKLYFSIVRTLKLILKEPFKVSGSEFKLTDTLDYRMVASNLENLCDAVENVAHAIRGENDESKNISKNELEEFTKSELSDISRIADTISDNLERAYKYYQENNEKKAVEMTTNRIKMEQYITQLTQIGVHQFIIEVIHEAVETIVDLLELIHANPTNTDE